MTPQNPKEEFRAIVRKSRRLLKEIHLSGMKTISMKAPRNKRTRLESFRRQALVCQACRLHKGRTQVVFGEGSLDARLVFVGEGPGREEDLQGRPFVGAAGTLLTKIIQAMGLQREEVYIANVVKCRPPMNRPPEPDEVAACSGYLRAQLSTIQPKIICALGKTAASSLLGTEAPMNQLRGRTFQWEGIPVIVTYHPAYLLRNPAAKKDVWADMQRILREVSPPGGGGRPAPRHLEGTPSSVANRG